jgi:site-specific DNA-methyltransferase (adenine-specific)
MIAWVYGSGFPKSLDVSKAIDKAAGVEREAVGAAIYGEGHVQRNSGDSVSGYSGGLTTEGEGIRTITAPATSAAHQWQGWGTALKPALEPITVARKPLGEKTVAANVLEHGTGAINVDGCRVGTEPSPTFPTRRNAKIFNTGSGGQDVETQLQGRWPANFIHDGSDEVVGLFPASSGGAFPKKHGSSGFVSPEERESRIEMKDSGSAARFFYCAKASKKDRDEGCEGMEERIICITEGHGRGDINTSKGDGTGVRENRPRRNHHPTVKPTALMRYLCRLVTQPGGVVLDPFMGSGSTGKAAILEGFEFIGIERDAEYLEIATSRIQAAQDNKTLL